MLLKLQKYDLLVKYVTGNDLHIADTLFCTQLSDSSIDDEDHSEELKLPVHTMIQNLPVSDAKKYNFRVLQKTMSRCNSSPG